MNGSQGRILPAIWKLLVLRMRISFNGFRRAKIGRKILYIIAALMLLGFAGFIFFLSTLFLKFLRSPELGASVGIEAAPLLEAIPVLVLTGLFIGVLVTSFGVLLQALYLSGDMDFLLSFPIPIRAVFVTKLMQAVLPNLGLISLFGLPILFGLGISGGYHFLYYPLLILMMIALAMVAAGFSSLLVMLVARIVPARRAAEVIGFLGALIAITCSQLGNFTNTMTNNADIPTEQLSGAASLVVRANTLWLPLNWAGRGLVEIGEGRWLSGTILVLATLGLCAVGFWFALATAERWYYSGWAGMQVVAQKKKPLRTSTSSAKREAGLPSWTSHLLKAPVRAMIGKDFLVMKRDLRNLSQLISPLIIGVLYTLMIFRSGGEPPPGQGQAPDWFMDALRVLLSYSNVGMALLVGWALLTRLASIGFSQEGKSFWMLKASPVRAGDLLTAKFLVSYLPSLVMGSAFLIVISLVRGVSIPVFLYSLLAVVLSLAGMNGVMTAFGAAGANFNWDDPRRMNAGSLGCLGQFVTMLILPISMGLFIAPLGLVLALQVPQVYGYLAGMLLGAGISLLCAILPLKLVEKKVQHLGEA
jgi:ABC-2 type transport system permease protein